MYFNALKCGGGVGMEDTHVENQFVMLYIINCYRLQFSYLRLLEIVYKKNIAGYFMDLYNLLYCLTRQNVEKKT